MIRVGDEVEHVGSVSTPDQMARWGTIVVPGNGDKGTVLSVEVRGGYTRLQLSCRPFYPSGYDARSWRKVQRRDLQAWLQTAVPAPHLDKRKRVSA